MPDGGLAVLRSASAAEGLSLNDLRNTFQHYGLATRVERRSMDMLAGMKPFVAFLHTADRPDDLGHFVVILNITKSRVALLEPITGRSIEERTDDLKEDWTGYVLLPELSAHTGITSRCFGFVSGACLAALAMMFLRVHVPSKMRSVTRTMARPAQGQPFLQ